MSCLPERSRVVFRHDVAKSASLFLFAGSPTLFISNQYQHVIPTQIKSAMMINIWLYFAVHELFNQFSEALHNNPEQFFTFLLGGHSGVADHTGL